MIRRLLLLLILLLPSLCRPQQGNVVLIQFPGAPTGSCSNIMVALDRSNGDFYDCFLGAWLKVNGGSITPQPFLNTTFFTDVTAASPTRGDGIFAIGATPTWQRLAHPSTTGGYFKWNGTDIVASTNAASGTGSPTACTNQVVTAFTLNADATPTSTCTTITSAFTSGTFPSTPHILLDGSVDSDTTNTAVTTGMLAYGNATPKWTGLVGGTFDPASFIAETPATLAVPSAPTLTVANTGGTIAQGTTVFVQMTLVNAFGETTGSAETSIVASLANGCQNGSTTCSVTATPVTSCTTGNATGCTTYDFTISNTEKKQIASANCVNITGACVIGTIPSFGGGVSPPIYNTAYNGTTVVPQFVGSSGCGTGCGNAATPIVALADSPSFNNFARFSPTVTGLPPKIGGFGMFITGAPGGPDSQPEGVIYLGDGTGHQVQMRSRASATDTITHTFKDGNSNGGLPGWIITGEVDAGAYNTAIIMADQQSGADLCAKVQAAINTTLCQTNNCVVDARGLQNAQSCASAINMTRGLTLLLGDTTITATTKFLTFSGVAAGSQIIGEGKQRTFIQTSSGTSDIIDTGDSGQSFIYMSNFTLLSTVTRTAGCGINLKSGNNLFEQIQISKTWDGICMTTNGVGGDFYEITCDATGATGTWNSCINMGNLAASQFISDPFFTNLFITGAYGTAGIIIDAGVDTAIFNKTLVTLNTNANPAVLMRNSGGGAVDPRWVNFTDGDVETAGLGNGFEITAARELHVENMHFQTDLIGIHINGSTAVKGAWFHNINMINIQNNCVKLDAGVGVHVSYGRISDCGLATNNTFPSVTVAANINDFSVDHIDFTCLQCGNVPSTNITVTSGTSDRYSIIGNTFANFGAASGLSDGGTGAAKRILENFPLSTNQANPIRLLATSDTSSTSNTLANITGLTWPVAASTSYSFDCKIIYQISSTTGSPALQLSVNGPATPTQVSYCADGFTALTASDIENVACAQGTTYQTKLFGAVPTAATTNLVAHIFGTLENGANAGTGAIQLSNPLAAGASVTVKRGSACVVQ